MQRKKPAKLTWTVGWRRLNKKIKIEESSRRRTRKAAKFQRAIVGASLEEIKKKRQTKPVAEAQKAALKEISSRNKGKKGKKGAAGPGGIQKPAASKQKMGNRNARAGTKR